MKNFGAKIRLWRTIVTNEVFGSAGEVTTGLMVDGGRRR